MRYFRWNVFKVNPLFFNKNVNNSCIRPAPNHSSRKITLKNNSEPCLSCFVIITNISRCDSFGDLKNTTQFSLS